MPKGEHLRKEMIEKETPAAPGKTLVSPVEIWRKKKENLQQEGEKIDAAIRQCTEDAQLMTNEKNKLMQEIPPVAASAYLGRIPKAKLQAMKDRISEIKDFLEWQPMLVGGLKGLIAAASVQASMAARTEKDAIEYELIRDLLLEGGFETERVRKLKLLAREVDLIEPTEEFLRELQTSAKGSGNV